MMTRARVGYAVLVVVGLAVGGCVPLRGMRQVPAERVGVKPPADQAAIVFMHAARRGGTTSLFELRGSPDRFIGLLVTDTRLVHLTAPGRTRFMVIGRHASFLDAELQAGKTYDVAVLDGPDVDEPFVLRPVTPADARPIIQHCVASCAWVENTEKSEEWARRQWTSIQRKKEHDLPKWESRANRPMLKAADGR